MPKPVTSKAERKKRKRQKEFDKKKKLLQDKIIKHTNKFEKNINESLYINQKTHSWFNIRRYKQESALFDKVKIVPDKLKHDGYRTMQYELLPTTEQQFIIQEWLRCYTLMYNDAIKFIRSEWFKYKLLNKGKKKRNKVKKNRRLKTFTPEKLKTDFKLNIAYFKDKLQKEKQIIVKNSVIIWNDKEIQVDSHLLDYAINDALIRYKACLTNIKQGNIRRFRLRDLKFNRNNQIFKLENLAFKKHGFSVQKLGSMKIDCKDFNYIKNIHTVATLHYSHKTNTYKLLVKYNCKDKIYPKIEGNIISLDPGIRTIFTGYSKNEIVEIGTTFYDKMSKKLKRIDNILSEHKKVPPKKINKQSNKRPINKKTLSKSLKEKIIKKQRNRIKNLVNDFHWKTINYLTKTYTTILIGNFSTKDMGMSNTVTDMVKRVGSTLNLCTLRERLKYKCKYTKTEYKFIDEAYTSKCCCKCGTYNKNLGSNKRYKCINNKCNLNIGRDINGAINIFINGHH